MCLKRAWNGRDNNRVWDAGISRVSVVCVVIKRGISETGVRGNRGSNRHVDSLSCKPWPLQCFITLSHPCAELHHYCWEFLPQGSGHLGSSCLLALDLQEDWLSDVRLCSCFVLNRGVFGKQGYQCQGKVLCPCVVCVSVWDVLSWESFPVLLAHPAVTSFYEVTTPLAPQPKMYT